MIIIFTLSYPFTIGKEKTFIDNEIKSLYISFDNLLLIPTIINNEMYNISFELNVKNDLAQLLKKRTNYIYYLFDINLYHLLIIEIFTNICSLKHPQKLFLYIINTLKVIDWIKNDLHPLLKDEKGKIILYTYWFTHVTTALCYYYKKSEKVSVVTRAHGIDLYEYRNENYIPLRKFTIKHLKRFYFVSEKGKEYITKLYPKYKNKYYTYPLGVKCHGNINKLIDYNKFHFVSCSNVDKNKNVGLILDALINIAKNYQTLNFIWTHFGDGNLLNELKKRARKNKLKNIEINFVGYKENSIILDFYEKEPINVFITTSLSEGGRPISVQEALSYGIPVIATNVGGIPEIVNNDNGFLLSSNPDLFEVINAIETLIKDPELWNKKRNEAYITWNEKCNSEVLTQKFIEELKTL